LGFVLLCLLPYWWVNAIRTKIIEADQRNIERATRVAGWREGYDEDGNPYMEVTSEVGLELIQTPTPQSTPTPIQIILDIATAVPPTPSQDDIQFFKLSFYDPAIGRFYPEIASVNCAVWDPAAQECRSLMSNGDTFMNWYGRGVACPPPMQLGDVVRVVYPPQLVGDWTCVDRGGAIVNGYLDFLLRYPEMIWTGYNLNHFPWSSTVQAYHLKP